MNQKSRLVLGTAQLGMPYGIANRTGQPDINTAEEIVATAWESGVREFDTAQAYGVSEEVLGIALNRLGLSETANVITKLDPDLDLTDFLSIENAITQSLTRLNISRVHGLMLHKEDQLDLWDKGLGETLFEFVNEELVDYLGVSVYTPAKAAQALQTQGIDMVQLPSNILDRRFENAGIFAIAQREQKQIYLRSVFLQGLLLMNAAETNHNMRFAVPVLEKLEILANKLCLSRQELALGFVKQAYPGVKVLFGAEIAEQVTMNMASWEKSFPEELPELSRKTFQSVQEEILNPALWPK